jgi:hypothetical protein
VAGVSLPWLHRLENKLVYIADETTGAAIEGREGCGVRGEGVSSGCFGAATYALTHSNFISSCCSRATHAVRVPTRWQAHFGQNRRVGNAIHSGLCKDTQWLMFLQSGCMTWCLVGATSHVCGGRDGHKDRIHRNEIYVCQMHSPCIVEVRLARHVHLCPICSHGCSHTTPQHALVCVCVCARGGHKCAHHPSHSKLPKPGDLAY